MEKNLEYFELNKNNLNIVTKFINFQTDNNKIDENYINWWYLEKKFANFCFIFSKYNSEIVSIATINNLKFIIDKKIIEIGLPQNVVTSREYRGRGFFRKVFLECEKRSLEKKIVNFITFTNSASTKIFLNKFKYIKGICPKIVITPIFSFLNKNIKLKKVKKFDGDFFANYNTKKINYSVYKDKNYLLWRYEKNSFKNIHILEFKNNKEINCYLMIKFSYRKKFKVCYLLDVVGDFNRNNFKDLRKYIALNKCFFLISLENENLNFFQVSKFNINIINRFNFLIKNDVHNEEFDLSKIKFNFSFGDIDFINYA